jgi:5,5'-dehydrodivanillate O-demethylase
MTELTDALPTKAVRVLGEDLVLFRDKRGNVGLLADHCAHRGASLLYGRVEERGIACAYHGWLYDTAGSCLECPAEPAGSMFHLTVKQLAYPVRPHLGLYWAYLGPGPAPLLPTCALAPEWSVLAIEEQVELRANWLQVVENNMDGAHFPILHQEWGGGRWPGATVAGTTRGYIDQCGPLEYWEEPWGIMRRYGYRQGGAETDALIFPNIRRHHDDVSIKVPVDDVETHKFVLYLTTSPDPDRPVEHWVRQTHREVRNTPDGRYRMDQIGYQDVAVMETQGRISARETWRMGTSDHGLALYHDMLLRAMADVERGLDPQGVVRGAEDATIPPVLWEPRGRFRGNGIRRYPEDAAPSPVNSLPGTLSGRPAERAHPGGTAPPPISRELPQS